MTNQTNMSNQNPFGILDNAEDFIKKVNRFFTETKTRWSAFVELSEHYRLTHEQQVRLFYMAIKVDYSVNTREDFEKVYIDNVDYIMHEVRS